MKKLLFILLTLPAYVSAAITDHGSEALESVQNQHDHWDIVLMDCEMPTVDGFEASKQIRAFEQQQGLDQIPIVALTAHAVLELKERCLASGMLAHMAKPVQFDELGKILDQFARPQRAQSAD